MNLSEKDKEKFDMSIRFFQPLLERDIKDLNKNLELKLISFAIEVESEFLYFDYPHTPEDGWKVDMINDSLENPESNFFCVDDKIYSLLDACTNTLKYIAYSFEDNCYPIKISNKIYSCLSPSEISENTTSVNCFFPVMYYSAFPDNLPSSNFEEVEIEVLNTKKFKKWFIVIHNEDIEDNSNKIISNYCLILNSDFETLDTKWLNNVSVKLKNFSKYYGSKDFNVILRKSVEYGDSILSLNTEIYHHIKELNSNLSLLPIQKLKRNNPDDKQISIIERNLNRIQKFYENYVQFLKTKSSSPKIILDINKYFNEPNYESFKNDICATIINLSIETNLQSSCQILTIAQYFDIIVKELILNAVKSFEQQNIENKKILIHARDSKQGVVVAITSCETRYKKNNLLPLKYLGLKLIQGDEITGECGSGLYLINKLLNHLRAISHLTKLGDVFFKASNEYNGNKGFTIEFILPKNN